MPSTAKHQSGKWPSCWTDRMNDRSSYSPSAPPQLPLPMAMPMHATYIALARQIAPSGSGSGSFLARLHPSLISVLVLVILTFLHATALYLFSQGFLLSRQTLADRTPCPPSNAPRPETVPPNPSTSPYPSPPDTCHLQPTHSKLILVLIDALRYDFLLPHSSNYSLDPFNQNQLTLPSKLTLAQPNHSTLFHFLADAPTTTLQRLKGLTTGTLPTFIDLGSNFASTNLQIEEDSWLAQLHHAGKTIGFAGDDTWLKLFGKDYPLSRSPNPHSPTTGVFHPNITFGYESFNVEDLDTVDRGVERHFFDMLGIHPDDGQADHPPAARQDWHVLIGHLLGLDHAGHRFGASHPRVQSKLHQYDRFLERIVSSLDDDTLLVLIGDHGMDAKGDHGGDSFLEVSTALWLYSKTRPLLNPHQSLPHWALDPSASFVDLQPSLGRIRTVSQIDLVPTLSLMLGVPIPFSNLGSIIPELFFRTTLQHPSPHPQQPEKLMSAIETLSAAMSINSEQLWKFVDRYTGGSSHSTGQDLAPYLPELSRLYQRASELTNLQQHAEAFQAHRDFSKSLLSTSRRIWAKFLPSLMSIGILIMFLSLLVTCKLINCIKWTTQGPRAPIRTTLHAGLSVALAGLLLGIFAHYAQVSPDLGLFSASLAGSSLGLCVGILTHRPRKDLDTSFRLPSASTLFKLLPVILHGIALGSNSYTVWEDRVVLHLISFSVLLPILISSFHAPQKREEQAGNCLVTFYASSTSSNAPTWVMSISLPLALALPIVPAWFLGFSDSYRGPASFYFGSIWRIILLLGSQYWITDYILSHEDLKLSSELIETGNWIKWMVGRVDMILCLFVGGILWFILPLCIDCKRDEVENENKEGKKPRLIIIGFANSYGSSYLIFLTAGFGILFLVTPPVGQVVLSLGFIAILALVELNDSLQDASKLKDSFSKAIQSAAQPNVIHKGTTKGSKQQKKEEDDDRERRKIVETDWRIIVGLNFLGYLIFFGTGHQATFASIQWKTGFIGLKSAHHTFSAVLIALNTLSGFILVALSVPLLKVWNLSPTLNLPSPKEQDEGRGEGEEPTDGSEDDVEGKSKLESEVVEVMLKLININVFLNLVDLVFVFYLRRHLMVWKIFCPRFLLSSLLLLSFDLTFSLLVLSLGFNGLKFKISRCFGRQNYI